MALADILRDLLGRPNTSDLHSKERQDFVRQCADMGDTRLDRYRAYDDLYDNKLCPPLDARQKQYLEQIAGFPFGENFCAPIVDKMAHRLNVLALRVEGNEPAEKWLNEIVWPRNRMDGVQKTVHAETLKKGDGFLIVSFDNDRKVPVVRWNRPEKIKPVYDDDTGELLYATKLWSTRKRSATNPQGRLMMRLNIYLPDRVEKWFTFTAVDEDAVWSPHRDLEADAWPTPWTESQMLPTEGEAEDPLGVPVPHFRNRAGDQWFGRSELRAAVPFKHELDKWLLDLFDVMDVQGAKQRWASGVENAGSLSTRRGAWVTTAAENARFGELDAEDPTRLLETIRDTLMRMSAVTATPFLHLWSDGGQAPSGESLKSVESDHTAKCEDATVSFGNSWEDAARMCWRLGDVFGEDAPPFDPDAEISCEWDSVETRDDQAEMAKYEALHRLGVSKRTILRELGYDPDDEADARAEEAEAAAEAAQKAFDRGAGGGPPYGGGRPPVPPPGGAR